MTAKIHFSGRLGDDANVQELDDRNTRVSFSVAVDRFQRDGRQTDWFNCTWYTNPQSKTIGLLQRGTNVVIHGEMITKKGQSRSGDSMTYYNVVIRGVNDLNVILPPKGSDAGREERRDDHRSQRPPSRGEGLQAPPPPKRVEAPSRDEIYDEPGGYEPPPAPGF